MNFYRKETGKIESVARPDASRLEPLEVFLFDVERSGHSVHVVNDLVEIGSLDLLDGVLCQLAVLQHDSFEVGLEYLGLLLNLGLYLPRLSVDGPGQYLGL